MKKEELRKLLDEVLALPSSIIHHDKPSANKEHPTMKPIGLMGQLIANSTRKDEIVLDGFLGSGSTMVAAHQLGRKCYGVEMDPQYAQVTIDRMLSSTQPSKSKSNDRRHRKRQRPELDGGCGVLLVGV